MTYSQAGQDLFALEVLGFKRGGTYLEIGSGNPIKINNTYLMESEYDWEGVSVEIDANSVDLFREKRRNPVICADALILDYREVYAEHGLGDDNGHVDYLSVDIEADSFLALLAIGLVTRRFSVITFEHNIYTGSETIRRQSRELLIGHGYTLVAKDVAHRGNPFEDWYVDPGIVKSKWQRFCSEGSEGTGFGNGNP